MSWTGFNKNIRFYIIRKLKERQNSGKNQSNEETGTDYSKDVSSKIWLRIPSKHSEPLKSAISKHLTDCSST